MKAITFYLFSFNFLLHTIRCDSFGNRPVTAPTSQNRSVRVRSGSTGNRPQAVNHNYNKQQASNQQRGSTSTNNESQSGHQKQNHQQPQQKSQQQNQPSTQKTHTTRPATTFTIREPPHQQQSQQHNFAAPRKGIFNTNSNKSAPPTVNNANKDLNTKLVQNNNKEHNKENLVSLTKNADSNDNKLLQTASNVVASTSETTGNPNTNATTGTVANAVAVTAGNGGNAKNK